MRLAENVVIFCLTIAVAALSLNNDNPTASTRRRLHDSPRHRQHLESDSGGVRRRQAAAAGNDTGHTQIYCHNETQPPIYFTSQPDTGGPGLYILNADPVEHGAVNGTIYFLSESDHDFVPYLWTVIGGAVFVVPCPTFEGRLVRGDVTDFDGQKHMLGTWTELAWNVNGTAWGDVSLLEGNDGPVIMQALDGTEGGKYKGFSIDVLSNAPAGAEGGNSVAKAWETQLLDPNSVYLEDDINPVINSNNGRFSVTFFAGIV
ncbi:hypothetical protein PG994_003227 [Apiospora phragmitis]|uniref:Uncharacterized protein n=1 Tax=Apiospora phragmitis TaxID=2905665 RepID=A0ABR1VXH6_9PEZI